MEFGEFEKGWNDIIEEIRSCSLTEDDCKKITLQFDISFNSFRMSNSPHDYTFEIMNKIDMLRGKLDAVLMKAKSNYREKHGENKINKILDIINNLIKKIPSPPLSS